MAWSQQIPKVLRRLGLIGFSIGFSTGNDNDFPAPIDLDAGHLYAAGCGALKRLGKVRLPKGLHSL
jgi:hypothetical protein